MNKEELTVAGLIKRIESGEGKNIQLRNWELAEIFGVYEATIRANIKSIINNNIVKPDYRSTLAQTGGILLPEIYGPDMVITLALQKSPPMRVVFQSPRLAFSSPLPKHEKAPATKRPTRRMTHMTNRKQAFR